MKKLLLGLPLIAASAGFYATPYYTAHQMQQAAQANDSTKLNSYIDYSAVKQSLKASLNSSISQSLLKNKTDSGMNAFATMFAAAFVNPLIDVLVTPENLSLMLQANMPKDLQSAQDSNNKSDTSKAEEEVITHKYYQDFDHFVVDVAHHSAPDKPFSFTFSRQGLLGWKLTGLAIPNFEHESLK
ncbi:MAG: DUF2939 domain-containing protein [Moraxellaceae bacterium]|nr:DUF2939 domain-containing protein [Pseudomonadales bacterium]MCB1673440.1 DUF2939 domain-containing protein [Pseudomonadales bacterium]MCP5174403.1 DUF2939 domain-containing protein [Moraxellaceae bacterium]MCP5177478.1 DUF2939 domain-containing protein [Moraxellaceae bacterium]